MFYTNNPRTGEKIKSYNYQSLSQTDQQLQNAWLSFQKNIEQRSKSSLSQWILQRQDLLIQLAEGFLQNKEPLSLQISLEMGKSLIEAVAEIVKSISAFRYYAEVLPDMLQDSVFAAMPSYRQARVCKMPLGPVLAIMPWNFPLWQLVRFAAPAVAIGNPILLKHSDITAGVAEMIENVFSTVSPELLFNLRIDHDHAAKVIADPRVCAITLTGSSRAGREVASLAGKYLKKSVLELGGSDPYLVLADANLPAAAAACARSRMINNGQSCIAAKRILVDQSILAEFGELFCAEIKKLSEVPVPMAHLRFKQQLQNQFEELVMSAEKDPNEIKLVLDLQDKQIKTQDKQDKQDKLKANDKLKNKPDSQETDFYNNQPESAAFFAPKVFSCSLDFIKNYQQELFGPITLLAGFSNLDQAVAAANASVYGLGSAIFSQDLSQASALAMRLQTGVVAINGFVKSDPKIPFGGVKDSGFGRELGLYGFDEFCNIKSIVSA